MISALAQLLFSSLVCVGLLAVWAATSPRHWFLRTGAFTAALALLLLIPAYEPLVVFALQGTVIAAGVQGACSWRRRKEPESRHPSPTRYSLATLLLLTVFVAIAAAVFSRLPEQGFVAWQCTMLTGVVSGIATLLGLWMVYGQRMRWWQRVVLGLVLSLGISLPLVWDDWLLSGFGFYDESATLWIPIIVCVTVSLSVLLWLMEGLANGNSAWSRSRWKRSLAIAALLLAAIALVRSPAEVYYQLMTPLPIPQDVMPNPNGWDDLVAAGAIAANWKFSNTSYYHDTAPLKELTAAVNEMKPAYERVQIGLAKDVQKPIDYSVNADIDLDRLMNLRTLARTLAGRGWLAKSENRFTDAASSYLNAIQLGYATRRGGLIVDAMAGIGGAGSGRRGLFDLRSQLSEAECLKLIPALVELESQCGSSEDFNYRDRVWVQHAYGWQGHLWLILDYDDLWSAEHAYETAFDRERAEMRLLRLELAIQAWRQTVGSLPKSLSDLVPKMIDEIPVDPFDPDGGLLQYRRAGDGYVLYSVGPNGIDDGGIAPDEENLGGFETGDLRLDIKYAPEPAAEEDNFEDGETFESLQK